MDEIEARTVVYAPPDELYDFLVDFPGYARYSEYLDRVTQDGDGTLGTRYALQFSWWKLAYTARSEVTAVDPPERIDWRIIKDIDAEGYWQITPTEPPDGVETATEVVLHIEYDASSASSSAVDLPKLVSMGWVIEKVKPLVRKEATRIVRRVVDDIEGEPRDADVEIRSA
ncbi:SRPBCC family protein [Haloarcula sp. S1CR25-12]|uniref:SRPBCC family protein n=1 Tax=Haloarcula saliterrae TaxID=2950534 RepID=A0ABU2F6Y5_9EURY|nr:SRPBCC family protein [Haloarcula sp. S1CR25-12]MDS0258027.1 SRPBCC family protein [Haloarcula sp. S1CR25-12]